MTTTGAKAIGGRRTVAAVAVLACLFFVALFLVATLVSWQRGRISRQELLALDLTTLPATGHDETPEWFRDVAQAAGVDFHHRVVERMLFPEIMAGGAAFLDYDGDGHLDLYLVQAGDFAPRQPTRQPDSQPTSQPSNRLYRNRGDGTFVDVTAAAGVGDTGYGMGCAVADYDGDGAVDLFVTNVGADVLYRNRGDGTFEDVTALAGVGSRRWGTSAAFLDYDRDGSLDLFVTNYIEWQPQLDIACFDALGSRQYCNPQTYRAPAQDLLYRNRGDGTFEDVSARVGLDRAFGNGLGVVCADFDGDGWIDIYVANDGTANQLWMNQAGQGLVDRAVVTGCAVNLHGVAEAGMGVVGFDLEDDGDIDLFVTHLQSETNTCYRNESGSFTDHTVQAGLAAASVPFTSFGTGLGDFDRDGFLDLFVANGAVTRERPYWSELDPYAQPNQLFRGLGEGRFEALGRSPGDAIRTSRAAAFGDYDNDGDIDIAVVDRNAPVQLLQNVASEANGWIAFQVVDRDQRTALWADVAAQIDGRWRYRRVESAFGYCASSSPRVDFGLGSSEGVSDVRIHWPDGSWESFGARSWRREHRLRQGEGQPTTAPR